MKFTLYSAAQGHQVITEIWLSLKPALIDGKKYTLEVKRETRSNEQNRKYHAMIDEIAEQAAHLGSKWDSKDWKRLLVQKFCKAINIDGGRIIPNLDGDGIVQLDYQTRNFDKEHGSEFIEFLYAWGAENGVTFNEQ